MQVGNYTALVKGRDGLTIVNRMDTWVGNAIINYGEYSRGELLLFEQFVKPGDVVIEGGAHIGSHTVALSRMCKTLYAFEPQRVAYYMLCGNLALGECENVFAFQKALGKEMGTVFVPRVNQSEEHNDGGVKLGASVEGEAVPMVTIDSLGIDCQLIKLDVEEMEMDVLLGAQKTIARCRPIIYLETNHTHRPLFDLMTQMQYDMHWHHPPVFRADNFFANEQDIFSGSVSFNAFCVPREREIQVSGDGPIRVDDPQMDRKEGEQFIVYQEIA